MNYNKAQVRHAAKANLYTCARAGGPLAMPNGKLTTCRGVAAKHIPTHGKPAETQGAPLLSISELIRFNQFGI